MQVLSIEELFKQRVTNVVFMGMGEPLMNLGAVLPAQRTLNKVRANFRLLAVLFVYSCLARPAYLFCLQVDKFVARQEMTKLSDDYVLSTLLKICMQNRNYSLASV